MIIPNKELFNRKFKKNIDILNIINSHGYEAYFVGGCVRDYLMGLDFSDIDITTSATPIELKKIFNHTIDTGLKHGTITVGYDKEYYEITTYRTESDYENHRSPKNVNFVKKLSCDLERRDFTINAMAINFEGELVDLHNGREDIEKKMIRTVNEPNERFYEDALRMLRAFRFLSKLDFSIEDKTYEAIKKNKKLISYISIERIIAEFRKMFKGNANEKAFKLLIASELNEYIPFFKYISKISDFSKYTFSQIIFYLYHFNNIDFKEISKLKLSNKEIKEIKEYITINSLFKEKKDIKEILYYNDRKKVVFINNLFNYKSFDIYSIKLSINSIDDIKISPKDLITLINKKPGGWIKELIRKIELAVLFEEISNTKESIIKYLELERGIDNEK